MYCHIRIVWNEEKIPEDCKKGLVVRIFKKDCGNYMYHCGKIYKKILESGIRKMKRDLRDQLCGYKLGRSIIDLIFVAKQLQERQIFI